MEEEAIRSVITEARQLIEQGNTPEAIALFTQQESPTLRNQDTLSISSHFHRYQEKKRREVLSNAEAVLEHNKINLALLEFLDDLEQQLEKSKTIATRKKEYSSIFLKVAIFIVGLLLLFFCKITFFDQPAPSLKKLTPLMYKLKDSSIDKAEKQALIEFMESKYFEPETTVEIEIDNVLVNAGLSIPTYLKRLTLGEYNDCSIKEVDRHLLIINCPNK